MLTEEQKKQRAGRLTASRVAVLMKGVAADVMDLYLEIIGEKEPKDLSKYWPVYHGSHTEAHHLDWLQDVTLSQPIIRRGEVVIHPRFDYFAATLDGYLRSRLCPVEVKNTGGRESFETVAQRYMPQMHWQMICTNATECLFSVIQGAAEPQCDFIEMNHDYAGELLERGHQFMEFVRLRKPPVTLPPVEPPAIPTRVVDMSMHNLWSSLEADYVETIRHAKANAQAAEGLKELVPADVKRAFGRRLEITVNKRGAKAIKELA